MQFFDLVIDGAGQARKFGCDTLTVQEATKLRTECIYRVLALADSTELSSSVVLMATGLSWRRLQIPNMDQLIGAGIYDGAAATEDVNCKREEGLAATMSSCLMNQINATANIEVIA